MSQLSELKKDDSFRIALGAIVSDETLLRAILALRDAVSSEDVDKAAPEIASVRLMSRRAGYHAALSDLIELAKPMPDPPPEFEEATYGVTDEQP